MPNQQSIDLWLPVVALILATAGALWVDHRTILARLDPPGFQQPLRRALALVALTLVFWLGVFGPLVSVRNQPEIDMETLHFSAVFFIQGLLLLSLALWYALGFSAVPGISRATAGRRVRQELGLESVNFKTEIGVGVVAGALSWALVIAAAMVLAALLLLLGAGDWLQQESPPALITWLAALPVGHRLLVSLSAGVVEEIFFRGFLQKRIGLLASTALFVGAHGGYGQPFMFFGITLLSLFYGLLAHWRGSVWAAMVAHFLFDAVQLLIFIPFAVKLQESGAAENFAVGF